MFREESSFIDVMMFSNTPVVKGTRRETHLSKKKSLETHEKNVLGVLKLCNMISVSEALTTFRGVLVTLD